ncbi:MAG: protein kinase domain-containing protein, partial [Polyangiales bacterium]
MSQGIPLGPYLLIRRLAQGGMAEVFLAHKTGPEGFSRELAVKRILPHLAEDPEFTSMFLDEARIAARLTHPNVVQVFDFGEADGAWYLAMELVHGVDLRAVVQRAREQARARGEPGAVAPHHAAKILSFVCEGLA